MVFLLHCMLQKGHDFFAVQSVKLYSELLIHPYKCHIEEYGYFPRLAGYYSGRCGWPSFPPGQNAHLYAACITEIHRSFLCKATY